MRTIPTPSDTQALAPGSFRLSAKGRDFIKGEEGFRSKAYADGGQYSIGYGHQLRPHEQHLRNATITREQGEKLFDGDVAWVEAAMNKYIKVPLTQQQADMVGSLVYNIGENQFAASPVLANLNKGNVEAASKQFGHHITSEGRRHEGLIERRGREAAVFNGGEYNSRQVADLSLREGGGGVGGRVRSVAHRVQEGAGNFASGVGDFFKGWFTDENGEFSWKKTALSAAGVMILAWAKEHMPALFWVTMAFVALAVVMVASGGNLGSFLGGSRSSGQGRTRDRGYDGQELDRFRQHDGVPEYDRAPPAGGYNGQELESWNQGQVPAQDKKQLSAIDTSAVGLPQGTGIQVSDASGAVVRPDVPTISGGAGKESPRSAMPIV